MDKAVLELTIEGLVKFFIGDESRGSCPRLSHRRGKVRTKEVEHIFEE